MKTHRFVQQLKDSYGNYIRKWAVFEEVITEKGVKQFLIKSYNSLYEAIDKLHKGTRK